VDVTTGPGCQGTVISDSWILTAGHCVDAYDVSYPGSSSVYASVPLPGGDKGLAGWRVPLLEVVPHLLWDNNPNHGHDLALLRVASGTLASIAPVQVGAPWDTGAYAAGVTATIMGARDFDYDSGGATVTVAQVPVQSDSSMASLGFSW